MIDNEAFIFEILLESEFLCPPQFSYLYSSFSTHIRDFPDTSHSNSIPTPQVEKPLIFRQLVANSAVR